MQNLTLAIAATPDPDFVTESTVKGPIVDRCRWILEDAKDIVKAFGGIVFTEATGTGIDDKTGAHEPCVVLVCGFPDRALLDAAVRVAANIARDPFAQRSIGVTIGGEFTAQTPAS